MAGLESNDLAWITARTAVARCGTARLGAFGKAYELKADGSGELIWNRPVDKDGDPDDTADGWTNVRE
jgi:hypothetical protein